MVVVQFHWNCPPCCKPAYTLEPGMPKFLYPKHYLEDYPMSSAHPEHTARQDAIAQGALAFWSNNPCPVHNIEIVGLPVTLRYTKGSKCVMCARTSSSEKHRSTMDAARQMRAQILDSIGAPPNTPTSRAKARALGTPYYFNNQVCPAGHKAPLITANACCRDCVRYLNGKPLFYPGTASLEKHVVKLPEDAPQWADLVVSNMQALLQVSPYFPQPD